VPEAIVAQEADQSIRFARHLARGVSWRHTVAVSPRQLRKLIKSAGGLTIRGAADALGMNQRQLYRYLAGDAEVPRVVELALKWVVHTRKETK
jgi:hypothetical protein